MSNDQCHTPDPGQAADCAPATHEEYESSGYGRRYPTKLCDRHADAARSVGQDVHRRGAR